MTILIVISVFMLIFLGFLRLWFQERYRCILQGIEPPNLIVFFMKSLVFRHLFYGDIGFIEKTAINKDEHPTINKINTLTLLFWGSFILVVALIVGEYLVGKWKEMNF